MFKIFILCCFAILSVNQAYSEVYETTSVPWSGYWWPFENGGLTTGIDYNGKPAPLEKFELLNKGFSPGLLVNWYNNNYYDINAPSWFGMCTYWSRASIYESFPIYPSSEKNIIFRIGDKKGFLTLVHDNDLVEMDNGAKPEIFHYWLLHYIKDQKKAFAADLDHGTEIWSYPIFKYDMKSNINNKKESVEVIIYYSDDFVNPDYFGTSILSKKYTYDLYLDSQNLIAGGEWTGNSKIDHPDFLFFSIAQGTKAPEFDYNEVLRIAKAKDDFLYQNGEVVDINPGTYNLILMTPDIFKIECLKGDIIKLNLEKLPGSRESFRVQIKDSTGNEILSTRVNESEPLNYSIENSNPPYILTLTQNNYDDYNYYCLKFDMLSNFSQIIPYIPKNSFWSGFALTNNNSQNLDEVKLIVYSNKGEVLQTLFAPSLVKSNEKKSFLFQDLPYFNNMLSDFSYLKLLTDKPIKFLNIFSSNYNESIGEFVQGSIKGNRIIISETINNMNVFRYMFAGVNNESFSKVDIVINVYTKKGSLEYTINQAIEPKSNFSIQPGFYPFYNLPDMGWIDITCNDKTAQLSGYQYISRNGSIDTLSALPITQSNKIVPHIPPENEWNTFLTVININNVENKILLHLRTDNENKEDIYINLEPYQKITLDLREKFGKRYGDENYRSILDVIGTLPIVGNFTYKSNNGADEASLPLFDDSNLKNQEIVLTHYPGESISYWTGICVFNPNSEELSFTIEPYDLNGNAINEIIKIIKLKPGRYEIFEIENLFGQNASKISFIKFKSYKEQLKIGGFYLYGNKKRNCYFSSDSLSGGVM